MVHIRRLLAVMGVVVVLCTFSLFVFTDVLGNDDGDIDINGETDLDCTELPDQGCEPATTYEYTTTPMATVDLSELAYVRLTVWGEGLILDPSGSVLQRSALQPESVVLEENKADKVQFIWTFRVQSNRINWDTLIVHHRIYIEDPQAGERYLIYNLKLDQVDTAQYLRAEEEWRDVQRETTFDIDWALDGLIAKTGKSYSSLSDLRFFIKSYTECKDYQGNYVHEEGSEKYTKAWAGFAATLRYDSQGYVYLEAPVVPVNGGGAVGGRSIIWPNDDD